MKEKLTAREKEITELFAWGASKKEIAARLFISENTVANHAQNIFEKTGCTKVNELSAWWFCRHFNIPMSLSPLSRKIIASLFLALYIFGAMNDLNYHQRIRIRTRFTNTTRSTPRNRNEKSLKIFAA